MYHIRWQRKARKQVAKISQKNTRIGIEEAIHTLSDLPIWQKLAQALGINVEQLI